MTLCTVACNRISGFDGVFLFRAAIFDSRDDMVTKLPVLASNYLDKREHTSSNFTNE